MPLSIRERVSLSFLRTTQHTYQVVRRRHSLFSSRKVGETGPCLYPSLGQGCAFFGVLQNLAEAVCDLLIRGHTAGASAKPWIVSQVVVPASGHVHSHVADHATKLSIASFSVARLFSREPYPWNPEERYALDVEIDALVVQAYSLSRAQYEVVLDSFEVLARIEIGKHGRNMFKEDCLAARRSRTVNGERWRPDWSPFAILAFLELISRNARIPSGHD